MTREELIKAIYDNHESWSCPEPDCPMKKGIYEFDHLKENCMKCAAELLEEYEDSIMKECIEIMAESIRCDDWCKVNEYCKDGKKCVQLWLRYVKEEIRIKKE